MAMRISPDDKTSMRVDDEQTKKRNQFQNQAEKMLTTRMKRQREKEREKKKKKKKKKNE
jgi:hypothetical protein